MKTIIVPLIGDPVENLYQLGLREKEAFFKIEKRVQKLLSTSTVVSLGQDLLSRFRVLLKKNEEETFFDRCIASYAEGLGIEVTRYKNFISLFEIAAHYGEIHPELKSLLPGCTSIFSKTGDDITHTRLLDFPLVGIFEERPRLYYWQPQGSEPLMTYSCEGLAPLFFQGLHGSGVSFALHHKPGKTWHEEGQSIFQIGFECLFETKKFEDIKRSFKKRQSTTKWSYHLLDKSGKVVVMDIDGPSLQSENYDLNDSSPLIFTNIPLQKDKSGFENFFNFSNDRQSWLKDKIKNLKSTHILDAITDVEDQKTRGWIHPGSTLSTVGAYHINLRAGFIDVKEGQGALVKSDKIVRFSLADQKEITTLKEASALKSLEASWKRISFAQSFFDQGEYDRAYHELQMAQASIPHPVWKEILSFYIMVWDLKFISSSKELSSIYSKIKKLSLPPSLKDQKTLLIMRYEKKLGLSPTVKVADVSPHLRDLFIKEKEATKPVFATWMKLLYPRIEILDIFSPHK